MAVAVSNSLMFFTVLMFMPSLAKNFEESSKLVNIHLFFVPEKEVNFLKSSNDLNFFRNKGKAHWQPLHLLKGKTNKPKMELNTKGVDKFRIEYRQFPFGDKHKGLEVMLKNVLVHNAAKQSHFNMVRFYKDCSKFLSESSDTKPKPGTVEQKRIDNTDDGVPLLLSYDSKFSSSLENAIIKYVPYRDDGTPQLSHLDKLKGKQMPIDGSTINGCIQINWESLVRELNNLQTRYHKRTLLSSENLNSSTILPKNKTSSLVRLLGLKIPNDSENVNMTLVREMLSLVNDTPVTDFHFPIPKVFHRVKSRKILSQTSLKDILKQMSKESPGNENKLSPELDMDSIDKTILKKLKLKAIDNELQFLQRNLSTLLENKKTKRRHRHSRYFRHRHRHPHRHHHRNRFKKLHYLIRNDDSPEVETFPSPLDKNPMQDYLVDNEGQTQSSSENIFNENEPGASLPYHDNRLSSLQDPAQEGSDDAERVQGVDEDNNLRTEMGLKLAPGPEMFSPKLGVPDLRPYLHDEFDKETKEANAWSDRYNNADITEAKRLSKFEEDTIMRQALGLPGEGNTAVGSRQQGFPFIPTESQQTPQQDEEESLNERIPQAVPSMGNVQEENPSMFNRESLTTMAWNRAKDWPSSVYQNNVPAPFLSKEFDMMGQGSGPFQTKQFPSMMSPYVGPLRMNYANAGMAPERGFARHGLGPLQPTMQYPYERNMFGTSLPFSTEQRSQQVYANTEEPQAKVPNPFQVWTRNYGAQANPFKTFGAIKKKRKRSKTTRASPSRHNKTISV